MTRLQGRARRGVRLKATAPFGHWATKTFIAGLRCDGLVGPWVIDHPMNRETFDIYVETQLAPTLQKGDVVILDNLPSHKSAKTEAMLRQNGAWFLFLPPYSPDLNPIEMAFAKPALSEAEGLKAHLRRIGARTIDALWKAIGDICALYSEQECFNFIKVAGYACD
jgi:transposase